MKLNEAKLRNLLDFIHEVEKLKMVMRHSWLSNGRRESVAEHTWRNATMAMVIAPELEEKVDIGHTVQMILVHDLAEIYTGDRPAWKSKDINKSTLEAKGLNQLTEKLSSSLRQQITSLWREYEKNKTPEAHLAKAVDKLEVLIQHNQASLKTWNKTERKKEVALYHGDKFCEYDPTIKALKDLVRKDTLKKLMVT